MTLPRWLSDPELKPLWEAAFRALARTGRALPRTVRLRNMTTGTRREVGALTGRLLLDPHVSIDAAELDAVLRERCAAGLLEIVEALLAPVPDREAIAAARAELKRGPIDDAIRAAAAEGLYRGDPPDWLTRFFAGVDRAGLVLRFALTADDLLRTLRAVAGLSANRPISRVQLAASTFGDAHALDSGTIRESLMLRGIAALAGQPVPATADAKRRVWESAGVSADLVSSTCLLLGIGSPGAARDRADNRGDGAVARPAGHTAARLEMATRAGDPVHLTGWDLLRLPAAFTGIPRVFVCENPQVLQALALRFGSSVPAVCVSGQPGLVALQVLVRLRAGGAMLYYHGDFDWPGIAITNRLVREIGVQPWAMTAVDYVAGTARSGLSLAGPPVQPSWDSDLGAAMRRANRAVHEEVVLGRLLERLAAEWRVM